MATGDEEKQRKVLDEITKELSQISLDSIPPEMGEKIHRIIRQITEYSDPYKKVKDKSNKIALALYSHLKEKARKASDPLLMDIRIVIAGNVIDFGINNAHLDIEQEIEKIFKQDFAIFNYIQFKPKFDS